MIEAVTVMYTIIFILIALFITKVIELFTRRKQKKIFLSLFLILFSGCTIELYNIARDWRESAKEYVKKVLEENNIIYDSENCIIERIASEPGPSGTPIYGIRDRRIKYKSRYFKKLEKPQSIGSNYSYENTRLSTSDREETFLRVITELGLKPYVLNEFIYDKRRGNNFEEIEKIFDSYRKKYKGLIIEYYETGENDRTKEKKIWGCAGNIEVGVINFVKNSDCIIEYIDEDTEQPIVKYDEKVIEVYRRKYREYFSGRRVFDEMDWEEYMKHNEVYPVITFLIRYKNAKDRQVPESELKEEIKKKIEPYFNKEIMYMNIG